MKKLSEVNRSPLRPVAPKIPDRKLSPFYSMKLTNGPVVRMFTLSQRIKDYLKDICLTEVGAGPVLVLVTANGTVELFNVVMRRSILVFESDLAKTTWGDIFFPASACEPVILIYSRQSGFHGKPLLYDSTHYVQLDSEVHMGLSVPSTLDGLLILPCGMHSLKFFQDFAIPKSQADFPPTGEMWFESAVAVIKPIEDSSKMVIVGTEDGRLTVINPFAGTPSIVTTLELTKFVEESNGDSAIIPIAIDGDSSSGTFVIGTESKTIFVVKWNPEISSLVFHHRFGLVNPGISTIVLRPDKNIIALGGWDGQVRYLVFPQMSRLVSIKAHAASLKCSHFFKHSCPDGKYKYYLATTCEAKNLTFWDVYN